MSNDIQRTSGRAGGRALLSLHLISPWFSQNVLGISFMAIHNRRFLKI